MASNCFIIGATQVLNRCAAKLLDGGVRIEGIFSDDPAVTAWAGEHGIPVFDPSGDLVATLSGYEFDYLFSIVNFRVLPREVLELPAVAAINFHDGPLPRYSGSHVPAWALYEGATRHAATWHLMTEVVDAGSVLLERWFPVREHSTALSLTYETAEVGIDLFGELVLHLATRTLPEPVDTSGRQRHFYLRSERMAGGGLIHAGTSAAEAERISRAMDFGSYPNPLGIPALVTDRGAVFTQQVRRLRRDDQRRHTTVVAVTDSAIKLAAPDADLLLSDFTAVDGSALSGQAAAQRLGIIVDAPLPTASPEQLTALIESQKILRANETWWRRRLTELRPAPLRASDFSAATSHYNRYELAFIPGSREERVTLIHSLLSVLAERMAEPSFDFAWSTSATRVLAEQTHGLAVSRVPVRFDGDDIASLTLRLNAVESKPTYATDLEVRLGLARRPLGSEVPTFTRIMVLERQGGEEASAESDTEVALLCLTDGPPTLVVRETAMTPEDAAELAEQVEHRALQALVFGDAPASPPVAAQAAPPSTQAPAIERSEVTVVDLISSAVAERPGALAVRCGQEQMTYGELDVWADAVAAHLYDQGIGPGSVVALLTERRLHLVAALLGIMRSGAAFLPLDPTYPFERLSRYTEIAECELVLTDEWTESLGASLGTTLRVPGPDGSALALAPSPTGDDLAYVLFTSGSTGEPKGVEIQHAALANFLTGIEARLRPTSETTTLAHTTVAFDISLLELLLPLTVGATVLLAPHQAAHDPQRLAELMGEVDVAQATPSLWRLMLDTGWAPHPRLTVLAGGEALPSSVARSLHAHARAVWNLYGPTEATIWASAHHIDDPGSFMPLGEPLANYELHVLDEQLQPSSDAGELYISGVSLARGYRNRPELTANAFLVHPQTGTRLYRTGDRVKLHEDGRIEWLGRVDGQIKVRGHRIEPAEIEHLLERSEHVRAAVVVATPFDGQGDPLLTAYVVTEDAPSKADLDAAFSGQLPDYMVPDVYVRLDALPLTDNGKVARRQLPQPTRDNIIRSAEPVSSPETPAKFATPEEMAETIAQVFSEVLHHSDFAATDNYFDLGGHSANVPVAAAMLTGRLGREVSPASIFAAATPARLAELLHHEPAPPASGPAGPATGAEPAHTPSAPAAGQTLPAVPATPVSAPRPAEAGADAPPHPTRDAALAVIGMACRFPDAATPDEFWANLAEGRSSIDEAPSGHRGWGHLWSASDETPTAWLHGVEHFDAQRFGISDREARRMDPLQRLLLSVTDEALESCGLDATGLGAHTGVFIGMIASDFPGLIAGSVGHGDPHAATGTAMSMLANRLSYAFGWSGSSFTVDTACSSSLVALHQAALHLRAGDVDAAVVGAANLVLTPEKTRSFMRNGMLSPQGVCRTFDDRADGYVRGEGCGVVILKRLADALRDGDPVLAIVRGSAVNHTGVGAGFLTAPSRTAQEAVIRRALAAAGVTDGRLGYVEAHGTGTQLGDLVELEALQAALLGSARGSIPVGSVKTNIGHLEPAAGIAGLIKTILALQARRIPPSLNFSAPNQGFRFEDSPLFVADRLLPWSGPPVAGVSSFGFGGANAHVVLEAPPAPRATSAGVGPYLLTLSARSETALRGLAQRLIRLLRSPHVPPLAELCEASRRTVGQHRLACVVDSVGQLDDKLTLFLARVTETRSLYVGVSPQTGTGTLDPPGDASSQEELEEIARRFVAGDDLPEPRPRVGVRFPTAPHDEKYLWLTPRPGAGETTGSPLRSEPVILTWADHPEAAGHVLLGEATLPAAAYPAKVAQLISGDRFRLRDVAFPAAARPPTTVTGRLDEDVVTFHDANGTLVCEARVDAAPPPDPGLAPPTTEAFTSVDLDEMYRTYDRHGLSYGADFRCLTWLGVLPGEAVGSLRSDAAGGLDPHLIDGCFQVGLTACGAQGLYVPFTVERLTVWGAVTGQLRAYARRDRQTPPESGLVTASVALFDGTRPVLELRGITWKRISAAGPGQPPGARGAGDRARPERPATAPTGPERLSVTVPAVPMSANHVGSVIAGWVAEALEVDVDTLELDRPLEEQGLDSMLAVSIAQDLRSKLDLDLPVTLLLEVGTVEKLVAELRDVYGAKLPPPEMSVEPPPPRSALAAASVTEPAPPAVDEARERRGGHDVAIVGYDGVFPGASDTEELWRVLLDREDCLQEVPKDRWDIDAYHSPGAEPGTVYLRRGGFVGDLTGFDPAFFRISPAEARWIDPQQRHLIQSAWRALEDAGLAGRCEGRSVGVFVGASYQHYRDLVVGDVVPTPAGLGNHNAILANRVSYFLDLRGPSMTIDTLCSSSLVALHTAVRSIRDGECDLAIVAGVHLGMSPQYFQLGSRLRSFSPSGASRAFDAAADGFIPGEGVVTIVIKPLTTAQQDGDRIRAIIKGTAINHGGRTSGLTVPNSTAQYEVITAALQDAQTDPQTIQLVEAHGTGTSLGDPIEIEGLTKAWRQSTNRRQYAAIGSLKTNLGHLEPAAGLAGLIKALLAIEHEQIPPTLHVTRPNDHIRFEDTPFYIADRPTPWPRTTTPRRAAISAFGMGGVNAHVIIEEPPTPPTRPPHTQDNFLLKVTGATPEAVRHLATAYARQLGETPDDTVPDFVYTANVGRASHRFRVTVTGRDRGQLVEQLHAVGAGQLPASRLSNQPARVGFLFTGQGSQYVGMGRRLYQTEPRFREGLDECTELLAGQLERPLLEVMFGDNQAELTQTAYAQPAIVAVQVGLVRLLQGCGVAPEVALGHSVGELTAAWVAGVFTLADLMRLAAVRGRLMQAQPATGAMAVIHADVDTVHNLISAHPGVEVAAYNAPRSVTVSGPRELVDAFCAAVTYHTQQLVVSHAFHSAAMATAVPLFTEAVGAVTRNAPSIPVASTLTGQWHTTGSIMDPQTWGQAIRQPVRFTEALAQVGTAGATVLWEIGPHPVLTTLGKATLSEPDLLWLHTLRRDHNDQQQLHHALRTFHDLRGQDLNWSALHERKNHRTITIPTYPFQTQQLAAPPARESTPVRQATSNHQALGHPFVDRHYEYQSEGL